MPVDYPFDSDTLERQGTDALFFYTPSWDKNPRISWSEKKGASRSIKPRCLTPTAAKQQEAQQSFKDQLFDGLPLMAKQRIKVDLKERKVTPPPPNTSGAT